MKDSKPKPAKKAAPKKPVAKASKKKTAAKQPSEYNKFVSKLMKEGKTMAEVANMWNAEKAKKNTGK